MTFDEWLTEIEVYSTRLERLESEIDLAAVMMGKLSHNLARRRLYTWLEAAYTAGVESQKVNKIYPYKSVRTEYTCTKCGAYFTNEKQLGVCTRDYCPAKNIAFGDK